MRVRSKAAVSVLSGSLMLRTRRSRPRRCRTRACFPRRARVSGHHIRARTCEPDHLGLVERDLRDWWDEFHVEVESSDRTAPPTPDERWQDALALYRDARAEALSVGIEPPSYPTKVAEEAIANVDAVVDDDERRLVIENESCELAWAAQQIEEFVRFTRFGKAEEARRRRLAETVRQQALGHVERSGGSYLAARRHVLALIPASPNGSQRKGRTGARPRGRRPRTSRTSRGSPGRSTDDPDDLTGRRSSRRAARHAAGVQR